MVIVIKIGSTFLLLLGIAWALLPGGFGLTNFMNKHGKAMKILGYFSWSVLVLSHVYVLYKIWFVTDNAYSWLLLPVFLHILFFTTVGRNVSTR